MEVAERELLAGESDVDDVLRQLAVELGPLERRLARLDGGFDRLARRVQRHARLALANLPERLLQLASAPDVAHAQLVQLGGR